MSAFVVLVWPVVVSVLVGLVSKLVLDVNYGDVVSTAVYCLAVVPNVVVVSGSVVVDSNLADYAAAGVAAAVVVVVVAAVAVALVVVILNLILIGVVVTYLNKIVKW